MNAPPAAARARARPTAARRFASRVTGALTVTEWTFTLAVAFWGLDWRRYGPGIDRQLDRFRARLGALPEAEAVRALHEMLLEKYVQRLNVYRTRQKKE